MAYCTYAEIQLELGQDNVQLLGDLTETDVKAIITQVDAYIDDMIRQAVYVDVPITSDIPEIIKRISRKMTKHEVISRQVRVDMPESVTKEFERAEKTLREIQRGVIDIKMDEDDEEDDQLRYTGATQVFSTDMP